MPPADSDDTNGETPEAATASERQPVTFGIVISTLGRVAELETLLDSLAGQTHSSFCVAVCVQGNRDEVTQMLARRADLAALDLVMTTSALGASLGRNVAARSIAGRSEHLLFPNDTSRYPSDFLAGLAPVIEHADAGCMTVIDEYGPKFTLPDADGLTRENVWSIILPGLVMRTAVFETLGGFDETMGTGASTPWQSGEETDIVLRLLDHNPSATFRWVSEVSVHGIADSHGLSAARRRRKLRAYGRGLGHLLVLHRYPSSTRLRVLLGGLTFGARNRQAFSVIDGWPVFLGRVEGLLGRTLEFGGRRGGTSAVDR